MAILFTRQHFQFIADNLCTEMTATEIDRVADVLHQTNKRFDAHKFKERAYKNSRIIQEIETVFDGIEQQQEIAMQRLERI